MSDTPKTDSRAGDVNYKGDFVYCDDGQLVEIEFARELERENATLRAALTLGQENCNEEYDRLRKERDANKTALAATRSQLVELRKISAQMAKEMRETDHEFASLKDYDAARREAQP